MKSLTFYTDGACSGNSGDGGWACVEVVPCSYGLKTNIMSGNKKKHNKQRNGINSGLYGVSKSL